MRKQLLSLLGALLLTTTAANAASIVVAVQNLPNFIDASDLSNNSSQLFVNAFDALIGKDYHRADAVFSPGLALSWEQTSPTTFEVELRQGVKFHDGSEMTADDVVFTFQRYLDGSPLYKQVATQMFYNFDKIEALDTYHVRFTTKKPEPLFEVLLNGQQGDIYPKKYIMGLTGDPEVAEDSDFEAFRLAPIGTGPYRITAFQPGETVKYERFEDYWGEKAPLDGFELRRIGELATRMTALANDEVDIITNVPPDQISTIEADSNLRIEGAVTPIMHIIYFNTTGPHVQDKRIRQALSLAIDRNLLNEALWLGKAVVPSTHTFEQYGDMYMPELQTFEYDPEKAKQLLAEAGYDGAPIHFRGQSVYYTNGLLAVQAVREMWAAVGVQMDLVLDEPIGDGTHNDAGIWSSPMYFADPAGGFSLMASGGNAGITWTDQSEAFRTAWDGVRYSLDLDERRAAFADAMAAVKDEAPVVPLYLPYESYGVRKNVEWKPLPGHIPYVLDFRAGSITVND